MEFSGASLLASLIVGTIGLSLFIYGKKQVRAPHLVVGMAMMVYPYFIEDVVITYGVAAALVVALWLTIRLDW